MKMLQCCIAVGPVVRHLSLPSMQLCYEFVLFSKWFSICQFPFPHGSQFVTFPMVPSCSFLSGSQSAPFHVAPNLLFSLWFQNCPFPSGAKFVIFEAVINLPGPFTSSPCWSTLCFSRFPNRSHLRALDSQGGKEGERVVEPNLTVRPTGCFIGGAKATNKCTYHLTEGAGNTSSKSSTYLVGFLFVRAGLSYLGVQHLLEKGANRLTCLLKSLSDRVSRST